ncbi:MAG TPA: alkaline phosphatase PhoX [Acidimicrobiia bacterium]|nr:alkaline phosphatase PhoX [Acidimicrobiia bacterium]
MNRRSFLRAGAVAGGALATRPFRALDVLASVDARIPIRRAPDNGGYGPLRPAGHHLDLPAGFRYVALAPEGSPMSNGAPTPPGHDGMAAFRGPGGLVRLVRNHEVDGRHDPFGSHPYDPAGGGGTVNLVFDARAGRLLSSHPTLTGTLKNCSGGPTPWGTWLSCEEGTEGEADGFTRPHGYCFEVPAAAVAPVDPEPIRGMGRFYHEAVCVDPRTGDVYETEDRDTAGFYRFRPRIRRKLRAGGSLQMLAVDGRPGFDTRRGQERGRDLPVRWVDIPDPDPLDAARNPLAVFEQGRARGGATFARLEGCWWHRGRAVLVSTTGGDAGVGQVWEYRPGPGGGRLSLRFESPSPDLIRQPDNVTATPRGGLLLCEDGPGGDRLCGLTPDGQIFVLARNRFSEGEFAGTTFSPDGRWLFVNVQHPGMTFAVTGPWGRGSL